MVAAKKWAVLLLAVSVSLFGKWVRAHVNHVVGEDRGWDPSTDVASWSSGRTFRVGDKLWFTYSAAHGVIVELKTNEEYESCDVSNPIKIYKMGLLSIMLDGEGIRYFVSSNSESCKKGLKLPVEVIPEKPHDASKVSTSKSGGLGLAAGPAPSGSAHFRARFVLLVAAGYWLSYMFI